MSATVQMYHVMCIVLVYMPNLIRARVTKYIKYLLPEI